MLYKALTMKFYIKLLQIPQNNTPGSLRGAIIKVTSPRLKSFLKRKKKEERKKKRGKLQNTQVANVVIQLAVRNLAASKRERERARAIGLFPKYFRRSN